MSKVVIVVLTISDSCYAKVNTDKSGPKLVELIKSDFPDAKIENHILPDDEDFISKSLIYYSDVVRARIIFTTGGTGFSPRDVTPEATKKVITKTTDGITTAMTVESLKVTPMAMASRSVSGIRNKTLIINFPGSVKAVTECYGFVRKILNHSIDLLEDETENIVETHREVQKDVTPSKPVKKSGCGCDRPNTTQNSNRRLRVSPYPMIEVDAAIQSIIDIFNTDPRRNQAVFKEIRPNMLGYITAEDIIAEEPFPPFEASIKDGYACRYEDGKGIRTVCDEISAGDDPNKLLKSGECAIINTGAPIPPGADCVVQIEDTVLLKEKDGKEQSIEILEAPTKGQDIRPIGSDIRKGEVVIPKNRVIRSAEIGLLASLGIKQVKVFNKPTLGILSTGNELQSIETDVLNRGLIRDSNKLMLISLLESNGFECIDYGIVTDKQLDIYEKFCSAFGEVDFLITTGGVSMGNKDFIKTVLMEYFHAEIAFGRMNMKPGKPTTFASCKFKNRVKYVYGLPGNPVSALVTCQILVLPTLMYYIGKEDYKPMKIKVKLSHDVDLDIRPHYARAVIVNSEQNQLPMATLTGNQISSRLMNSSGADVLLLLPGSSENRTILKKLDVVEALLIN